MKFNIKNDELKQLLKFQEGGEMTEAPAEVPAEAPEQGGSPEEQILQAAAQAVQTQDCQLGLQVCQILLEMAGGGGSAQPAPAAPEGQEPVYRKGGRLVKWVRK